MKKKINNLGCIFLLILFVLAIIGYAITATVRFIQRPDAFSLSLQYLKDFGLDLLRFIGGAVLCIGAGILLFILIFYCVSAYENIIRIRSHRIVRESTEFPVFCTPIVMRKWMGELPLNLAEEPGQVSRQPIFCHLTLTNHGLSITTPPGAAAQRGTEFPFDLFGRDWSDTVFISLGSARLFYLPFTPDRLPEPITLQDGAPGYHDEIPHIPDGHQLQISLVFGYVFYMTNLDSAPWMEHPLKLKIHVLDANGHEDVPRAIEFYRLLYSAIAAAAPTPDDDSWLYRSRPTYW